MTVQLTGVPEGVTVGSESPSNRNTSMLSCTNAASRSCSTGTSASSVGMGPCTAETVQPASRIPAAAAVMIDFIDTIIYVKQHNAAFSFSMLKY